MQFAQNKKQNIKYYQKLNEQEIHNKQEDENLILWQIRIILNIQYWIKKIIRLSFQILKYTFHVAFVGPRLVRHNAPGHYLEREEFELDKIKQKLF